MLSARSREIGNLPPFTRILITSRPEDDIKDVLDSHTSVQAHELDITSVFTERDIAMFIEAEMSIIRRANKTLNLASRLARSREGFCAHKACGGPLRLGINCMTFISECHDPRENIALLTDSAVLPISLQALDHLYETALRTAGNWSDNRFCSDCLAILGLSLVVKIPLSCEAMDDILSLPRPTLHLHRKASDPYCAGAKVT